MTAINRTSENIYSVKNKNLSFVKSDVFQNG
jgi:hypothetical protein